MSEKTIIKKLIETNYWDKDAVLLGLRAEFKCEYCGKNLLASVDNYKEWQVDHIVPLSKGGTDDFDNLALSCRTCNVCLKNKWNPLQDSNEKLNREQLIKKTKEYITNRRKEEQVKLDQFISIISNPTTAST